MILSKDRQTFVRAVGILIILQGLGWLALSIAGIVVSTSPPDQLKINIWEYKSYTSYLSRIIYDDFMNDNNTRTKVIRPTDFIAFLWIYAILSAVWVAASLDQNIAIKYQKSRQSHSTLILGVAILLTSIIDLVFVSLLARDYATCPFDLSSLTSPATEVSSTTTASTAAEIFGSTQPSTATTITASQQSADSGDISAFSQLLAGKFLTNQGSEIDCKVANGIVMTLAARGFVLWATNIVLGIVLLFIGAKALRRPPLMSYGTSTIPRVKIPEQRKAHSSNNDLTFYGDNDGFVAPVLPINEGRNRNTPVALTGRNQQMFY